MMTMRSLAAALLGLAIAAAAADPVHASCESKYRILKENTACLTGWWKHKTHFGKYTKGGVKNECEMGTMKVKIDISGGADHTIYEAVDDNQTRYGWKWGQTDSQNCCHDYGPCWENELGSVEDSIHWRIPGTGPDQTPDSGRYYGTEIAKGGCVEADKFCDKDKMDKTWFCRKSFVEARKLWGECGPYDCGDRYCGWGDCKYQWGQSVANDTCDLRAGGEFKWKAKCKLKVRCIKGVDDNGDLAYRDSTWEDSMWKADDLVNCAGKPKHEDKPCDNLGTDTLIGNNCADETEICTVDHCNDEFDESDAEDSCIVTSMSLDLSDWSNPKCSVEATCVDGSTNTASSLDDVPMTEMADLKDCDGTLTNGDCDDG